MGFQIGLPIDWLSPSIRFNVATLQVLVVMSLKKVDRHENIIETDDDKQFGFYRPG